MPRLALAILVGATLAAHPSPAQGWDDAAMRVEGDRLVVTGPIRAGFAAALDAALEAAPGVAVVALAGPGGDVAAAMAAARIIRARGLDTTLAGRCLSACTMAFLGGRARTIPRGRGLLGFHQASDAAGRAIDPAAPALRRFARHVAEMGARAEPVMAWMDASAPGEMTWPRRGLLCAARIATAPTCPGVPPAP